MNMLLAIAEQFARETELAAWAFCIGITLFICLEMFFKTKKREDIDKEQKMTYFLWVLFFVLTSIAHFMGVYARLYAPIIHSEEVSSIVDKISIIFVNTAYLIVIFHTERTVKPWKYPFASIFMLIGLIMALVIGDVHANTPEVLVLGTFMFIGIALVPLTYFYIGIKFGEPVRKKSLIIGLAITMISLGILFQRHNIVVFVPSLVLGFENFIQLNWTVVPTSLISVGVVMIYYSHFYHDL